MSSSRVVYSGEKPQETELIGSRKLINFNIIKIDSDIETYKYNQMSFLITDTKEVQDIAIEKEKAVLAKLEKQDLLSNLKVTIGNNTYDANEYARLNMSTIVMEKTSQDLVSWKMSDNSWNEVLVSEIAEALFLARQAVEAIIKGA